MTVVALHDSDATGFPNLALMKLSAHHKAAGDEDHHKMYGAESG